MMAIAMIIGVIVGICCEKSKVLLVGVLGIVLLTALICLIIENKVGLFTMSKYEWVIILICMGMCGIGVYRYACVTNVYEKYDRMQYVTQDEVRNEVSAEAQDKDIIWRGQVTNIKSNSYGYTIYLKTKEGEMYVYTDNKKCGFVDELANDSSGAHKEYLNEASYDENIYDEDFIYENLYGLNICILGEVVPMKGARNFGNYDEYTSLRSKGVLLKLSAENIWVEGENNGSKYGNYELDKESLSMNKIIARLKIYFKNLLMDITNEEEYGILAAMVLGENSDVDKEIKELYSISGISHIMAISGLHISLIGMGIYKLLRKKMRYISSAAISIGIMSFFLVFIGNPISARRAIIMFFVHIAADLYGRKYDVISAVSLALIILLLDNPYYLLNASFVLSFGAMVVVSVCAPVVSGKLFENKLLNQESSEKEPDVRKSSFVVKFFWGLTGGILKMLIFNISLCVFLLPLNSYLFYRHATYSPITNLIVVPLVGIVLVMTLLGMFMAVYNPLVGRFFIGTSVYILRFFTWVSEKIASLPYASIVTGKISLGELILCYVLLGICLIMIYFSGFRSKGRSLKGKHIDKIGICILMSLFFFIIFRSKYDGFSICFLDVGQGASIYIKSETGNDYLIDGGSSDEKNIGEYKLESFLEARQVDSLEYVFVTHCDSDHTSGIIELIERGNIVIGKLVLPDIEKEARDDKYLKMVNLAEERDIEVVYMKAGDKLKDGRLMLTCLNPCLNVEGKGDNGGRGASGDINENSLVFVAEYKDVVCIFTGDIGKDTECEIVPSLKQFNLKEKKVIYDVAHHGSGNSNSQEMIDCIKPDISIVSCGRDNSYGHPATEVIGRLEDVDSRIYYTYESGQIEIYEDNGMRVRSYLTE